MPVDLGDLLPDLGTTVTDNTTGALANATTVTLTLTLPDGTPLNVPGRRARAPGFPVSASDRFAAAGGSMTSWR